MASACVFCDIVNGAVSAHEVHRDDHAVAFLDRRPVFPGHVLVVPARHVATLTDLDADAIGPLFARVQAIAIAVQDAMEAHGTFVAINNTVSQSVPHLHVHVVPRRRKDGLRGFFWPRTTYASDTEAASIAQTIAGRLHPPE